MYSDSSKLETLRTNFISMTNYTSVSLCVDLDPFVGWKIFSLVNLRPPENMDICITFHNNYKITIRK